MGTIKSTINSAISLAKYSDEYNVKILNVMGEWNDYKSYLKFNNVEVENLTFNYKNFLPKQGFLSSRLSYWLIFIISIYPLLRRLKKKDVDYLVVHLLTSLPLILFNIFNFKTKLILRISGFPKFNFFRKSLWKFSNDKIFNVTCPSIELKNDIISKNIFEKSKISFLPDAIINCSEFLQKKRQLIPIENFDLTENFYLAIGRFTKQKNYPYLIKEFSKFCKKNNKEKLLIIGEGEQKNLIIKMIKQHNLINNIYVLDHTKNVYYYMKRAKSFILSSLWEEVGFVIVEAALSNSFIISSNCKNGPTEFLSNGNAGILYQSDKINALSDSLEHFKNMSEKNIYEKKVLAKKNSLKYTMFRHYQKLNILFNENKT